MLTPGKNNNFSHFSAGHSKHKETLDPYHYTSNQLITMSNKLKDNKYCILPFDTINKIGELGLNKHKARKYNNRYLHKPKMVNTKNLIQINTTEKNNLNNIRIATMNTRSVKNKQLQIIEIVELQNIDFIMLTETWLKNLDEDKAWVNTSDLNNNNLRLDTVNRMKRQGGGIALLHKKEHNIIKLETDLQLDTIEHGVWSTTIRNKKLIIYHPPIGSPKGNTHTTFLDEVCKLIQLLITNYSNLVLLGDFNIHIQDIESADSIAYNDMMEALGLTQHIEELTHRLGNTLDLIYTESLDRVRVIHSFIGNFISDHRMIGIELKIKKQLEKHQSTMHRNYKDFNLNNFSQVFNNNEILGQPSLDKAVQVFNEEMERTLDKIAPKEEKKEHKRQNKQWFTSHLLEQRKIVRN